MMRSRPTYRPVYHRGSMFIETAIGIALTVIVMIAVAQLVAVIAKQRRDMANTRVATREVANMMELAIVLPWDELNADAIAKSEISDLSSVALSDPELAIDIVTLDTALQTKQIEIALSWRDQANRRVDPVRLVAWKHQAAVSE
ncbi:MAG: hypothetical protein H6822_11865 [Planctomycetaceae bacterium]|nr:hypothetical protein [Planctomycetales bacterium]MCB9922873.1 hypothetical protein [Planctomycetaceae bacterium]